VANEQAPEVGTDRREFLEHAGKIAVAAPAVAILLSAASKPAQASGIPNVPAKPPS
jgi:hypothetical protein